MKFFIELLAQVNDDTGKVIDVFRYTKSRE